jgi:hypothetical protein
MHDEEGRDNFPGKGNRKRESGTQEKENRWKIESHPFLILVHSGRDKRDETTLAKDEES